MHLIGFFIFKKKFESFSIGRMCYAQKWINYTQSNEDRKNQKKNKRTVLTVDVSS